MSNIVQFRTARPLASRSRSALDQLIAAHARSHHEHESPLVGCYLCLHGVPLRPVVVAAAA
jgi:hypothetical protein